MKLVITYTGMRAASHAHLESRKREQDADGFAFKVSIQDDPSAVALAFPAYLLMAGLGGDVDR
jgi:hypothetical protein